MNIEKHISAEKDEVIEALEKLREGLGHKTAETKEMLETYIKYTTGKTSPEEVANADTQFQDLVKILGLSVFTVLPFTFLTLPSIVKLANKVAVDIMPSAFKNRLPA